MAAPVALWHEHLDELAQHFIALVAEHPLRLSIDHLNAPFAIDHHHRVWSCLNDLPETLLTFSERLFYARCISGRRLLIEHVARSPGTGLGPPRYADALNSEWAELSADPKFLAPCELNGSLVRPRGYRGCPSAGRGGLVDYSSFRQNLLCTLDDKPHGAS